MHLSPRSARKLRREAVLPNLWGALNRIRVSLGLDHATMADYLLLTQKEYSCAMQEQADLKITSGMSLAAQLNIGFDALMANSIDYKALSQHYQGNLNHLPDRYAGSALSKRLTIINILNFIEQNYGWERRAAILRRFQLNESIFENPDAPINMRLTVDICDYLYKLNKNSMTFIEMGKNAAQTHRISPVGRILSESSWAGEAYERMFGGLASTYVENNFVWVVRRVRDDFCQLEGAPAEAIKGALEPHYVKARSACMIRQGVIAAIPTFLGLPVARVFKSACISQGDSYCRFDISLPDVRKAPHMH